MSAQVGRNMQSEPPAGVVGGDRAEGRSDSVEEGVVGAGGGTASRALTFDHTGSMGEKSGE
jgi:hypothetical protein